MSQNSCKILILRHLYGEVLPTKKNSVAANSSGLLKMKRYTTEQRVFIVEQYLKSNPILATNRHLAVNQQNCGIWGSESLRVTVEKQIHQQSVDGGLERSLGWRHHQTILFQNCVWSGNNN